ncbi:MAG: acyl-CoA dehydrogenase family protein [Thermaerobacter sp.]|nr:acyl-CoA dehydrogenase family protein [Thermaerobacter sp.]
MGVHDERPEGRGQNFFAIDPNLQAHLRRTLGDGDYARALPLLERMGALSGDAIDRQAEYTDRVARPVLETYDRQGNVVNHVRYNPLYEESVRQVYGLGTIGCNYGPSALPYSAHFGLLYLLSESDPGLACPVTLTASAAFVIARHGSEEQRRRYLPQLAVREEGPFADGATWVTEKQGGSDAGAATTQAVPIADADRAAALARYGLNPDAQLASLRGEKWFASNADADFSLVTARPPGAEAGTRGLALYLLPRLLGDGAVNAYRIRRLKDKLGTTGLATGEIDLDGALAELVTPSPDGFKHMLEALEFSRIANAIASAGIHRRVFLEAQLYAAQRSAFGQSLDRFPMVQETIVTMLAELEAATALAFCAAQALDDYIKDPTPERHGWHRLTTALAKYRTGEVAVRNASRAIEVLGGNGYVEEYVTARMFREAQVLPVWEGPANIQALEVLRTFAPRWHADETLSKRIKETIDRAEAMPAARDLGRMLRTQWQMAEQAIGWLRIHPESQEQHARRLSDWLAEILEFALLLDEAVLELPTSSRKLVLSWWLARLHLAPAPLHGLGEDVSWLGAAYSALVTYLPLDAVALPATRVEVPLR